MDGFAQKKSKKDYLLTLRTEAGTMHLILFDETPKHKANFVKLVQEKFYDSLLFHRIIDGFMIQGGDPNSRTAKPNERLGNGGSNMERIPFEFVPTRVHRKGALAAASDGNPQKASNACQFYIVQGKTMTDQEITAVEQNNKMAYTTEQKEIFKTLGGVPRLDNNYTVFGQAIDNLEMIDTIAKKPRNKVNRPLKDVKMSIAVELMRKRK
jgi:cyclophilin family peptidyl-prolyl cis-trans isomerase